MTQDEIIEMAIQAGISEEIAAFNIPIVEAFANLVAAKEREACANQVQSWNTALSDKIAAEIRARGEA
jgi:hypothetical protein